MFPSSGEGGETPTQLGPLNRANLILENKEHDVSENGCFRPQMRGEDETSCLLFSRIAGIAQSV
jgi:hypothetical protein